MFSLRLVIICWFLLVTSLHYGQCCGPAEIGRQYTITSTADVPSNVKVVWQSNVGTILYDSSQLDPNQFPSLYVGSNTHITIRNVTKNDGTGVFQHRVNGVIVHTCKLSVFKRASTPTCEPVTLTGNLIRTTCTTAQVFPQAKCQFTLQNREIDRRNVSDRTFYITYTHYYPQPGGNEYYSTSCTLQYPVDGLKPGNWTVQVNMYPDQTGVSSAEGTDEQAVNNLLLEPPRDRPKISARSSHNGDILVVGDDVTVTCDVIGGYPPVESVTLSCGQHQTVTRNGTSAQLILEKIDQTYNAINCTCQATHVTGYYDLMSDLPLTVLCANPYKSEENLHVLTTSELVGVIVGSIGGILMLEAVTAMIIFFIRREKEKRKNRTEDTEYDKIQRQPPLPYQNVKPRDPNYQTINPSEQVSNIASANQETERTYNNQAFGEYEEPIEPDPNSYSDIQVD